MEKAEDAFISALPSLVKYQDPVVNRCIVDSMIVEKDGLCDLVEQTSWNNNVYSTLQHGQQLRRDHGLMVLGNPWYNQQLLKGISVSEAQKGDEKMFSDEQ